MHLARQKSRSDAEYYQMQKQAEANKLLLTRQYLELRKFEAIAANNKVYFGSDIPKMFVQGGCASDAKQDGMTMEQLAEVGSSLPDLVAQQPKGSDQEKNPYRS